MDGGVTYGSYCIFCMEFIAPDATDFFFFCIHLLMICACRVNRVQEGHKMREEKKKKLKRWEEKATS